MKDVEKIVVIIKSIFTLLMFVILSFIEPIFIYIAGASVIICVPIVLTFAFISTPYNTNNESEENE